MKSIAKALNFKKFSRLTVLCVILLSSFMVNADKNGKSRNNGTVVTVMGYDIVDERYGESSGNIITSLSRSISSGGIISHATVIFDGIEYGYNDREGIVSIFSSVSS